MTFREWREEHAYNLFNFMMGGAIALYIQYLLPTNILRSAIADTAFAIVLWFFIIWEE